MNVPDIRAAIIDALPILTSNYGEIPDVGQVYVPPAHLKALRLDCNLVIGSRGVGKSFWASALRSEDIRQQLRPSVSELSNARVYAGFGTQSEIAAYPDGDTFATLLAAGKEPYDVWRAVVARWLASLVDREIPGHSWRETVDWVVSETEAFARLKEDANRSLLESRQQGLIVFDALDRTSRDWRIMDRIVRDLLRVILQLKSFPMLHGKVFLRNDQFDRTVTDFPDASKLLATRVELSWARHDLHGLLWQLLCNAPGDAGEHLRGVYRSVVPDGPVRRGESWRLLESTKRETAVQKALFEALAGKWMGRDRRRGVPYIWSVGHLADTRGQTSPRSFLAAISAAAEVSAEGYADYPYPLHYEGIKRGVQKASEIRVQEMREDYPWVIKLMEPLRGVTVPCGFDLIEEKWGTAFPKGPEQIATDALPPQHQDEGWRGIREDLQRLGIFETMKDGRVNTPDLYRVGFGLGRRGGVRPAAAR